jgi:hypothetical protein
MTKHNPVSYCVAESAVAHKQVSLALELPASDDLHEKVCSMYQAVPNFQLSSIESALLPAAKYVDLQYVT